MRPERLSFFNEQTGEALLALTRRAGVLDTLAALRARVTMGLVDLSDARAEAVRRLNAAGIGVDVWLLLEREHGYFATPENAARVEERLAAWRAWSARHGLTFTSVGFDFEPDLRELDGFFAKPGRTLARWGWRTTERERLARAADQYRALISATQASGLEVETYQFPLLLEDRAAGSQFFQRLISSLDVPAHREVLMIYSSLLGVAGAGLTESWTRQAPGAVAVGSTGGGIDPLPKLSFEALARDLRWAARVARDVRVFSLEGCVEHDYLPRLVTFDWDAVEPPSRAQRLVASTLRGAARWMSRALR